MVSVLQANALMTVYRLHSNEWLKALYKQRALDVTNYNQISKGLWQISFLADLDHILFDVYPLGCCKRNKLFSIFRALVLKYPHSLAD